MGACDHACPLVVTTSTQRTALLAAPSNSTLQSDATCTRQVRDGDVPSIQVVWIGKERFGEREREFFSIYHGLP